MTKIVDALDREVFEHKYDLANQTLWTDHIDSGVKTVVYDLMGRPTEMKDAKGSHILNSYDDLNRPIRLWAADDSSQSLTLRNLAIFGDDSTNGPSDPKTTNHLGMPYKSYDEAGLVEITEYDFKGAPLEKKQKVIKDSLLTSTTAYTVDWPTLSDVNFQTNSDNLLEHKAHTGDTATDGYVTSTEYDGIGRPTKITYPKDVNDFRRELKPQYNKSGALCKVDFDGTEYVKEIAYDAKGQRLLLALGNGIMTRYAYSEHNFRLLRMCSETYGYSYSASTKEHTYAYDSVEDKRKQDLAYLYDLGGNIKSIKTDLEDSGYTENYGGTTVANDDELTRKFKYDAINRLIEAIGREAKTHGAGNVWNQPTKTTSPVNASGMRQYKRTYDYDKMGNIQELQHTSGSNAFTRNFNYRTGLNQLDTIDNGATPTPTVYTTYTHDANGNQTQLNSERYLEWDAADQLKFFKIDDGSTITKWSQYRYSGGQRVKKVYNVDGGNYTTTVYIDGIFEYQYLKRGGSTYERNYCHVMDDTKRIAQIRYGSAQEDITDSTFYIVDDHLGTSTLRLNTSGSLIDRQEYYPFGESSLRTFDYKRYQYTGKERDEESGLYYYGARYYSAWTCRFLGVDPMVSKTFYQGSYVYADNNPIMMNDPTGMVSEGEKTKNTVEQDSENNSNQPKDGTFKTKISTTFEDGSTDTLETVYTKKGDNLHVHQTKTRLNRNGEIESSERIFDVDYQSLSAEEKQIINLGLKDPMAVAQKIGESQRSKLESTNSTEDSIRDVEIDSIYSKKPINTKVSVENESEMARAEIGLDMSGKISLYLFAASTVSTTGELIFMNNTRQAENKITQLNEDLRKAPRSSKSGKTIKSGKKGKIVERITRTLRQTKATRTIMRKSAEAIHSFSRRLAVIGTVLGVLDLYKNPSWENLKWLVLDSFMVSASIYLATGIGLIFGATAGLIAAPVIALLTTAYFAWRLYTTLSEK